jgi:hypothetical protein
VAPPSVFRRGRGNLHARRVRSPKRVVLINSQNAPNQAALPMVRK